MRDMVKLAYQARCQNYGWEYCDQQLRIFRMHVELGYRVAPYYGWVNPKLEQEEK